MKKYIIVIIITLYCIIDLGTAKAAEGYEKTTAYRYTYEGYENSSTYDGPWTEWVKDKPWNFTDSVTNTLSMTNMSNYSTTVVTTVDVISSADGKLYFKGRKVAGSVGDMCLHNVNFDYFYRYPSGTSTVDTNYTVTINFKNPSNIQYNFFNVVIFGIIRNGGNFQSIATVQYRNNPSSGQYAFGNTYTYAGNDGYNYSGFIIAMDIQIVNGSVPLNDTLYHLWTLESNLDTYTPDIDYSGQLANIDSALGNIYSSITGGFTTVTNAITNVASGILDGIEHLFVYDDWQEDLESITRSVSIPYIEELTTAFADITSIFNSYYPDDDIEIKLKNPMYTQHGGNEYMVNTTYSLETPLSVGIGGYTIKQLFHIISGLFVLGYFVKIVTKLMSVFGIKFDEFILPWIREVMHR